MSWAKADDRYDDTSKIKRAWRLSGYAVGLHWMSVTACARHESDGLVDPEWLAERLAVIPAKEAKKAVDTLVKLGLYEKLAAGETRTVFDRDGNSITLGPAEEDTFIVHDYLEFQDSSTTLESRRAAERRRKAISARAKKLGMTVKQYEETSGFRAEFPEDSGRNAPGIRTASDDPDPTRPDPTRPVKTPPAPRERGEPGDRGLRASGRNPRAKARRDAEEQAAAKARAAAAALTEPTDVQAELWARARSLLKEGVSDSTWHLHLESLHLAGVDGGALVVDGEGWSPRWEGPLRRVFETAGLEGRLASQLEHDGLRAIGAGEAA